MNTATRKQIEFAITGMACTACASRIEKNLNKLPGVETAINFTSEKARVHYDDRWIGTDALIQTIEKADFQIVP
ncbi:Cu+-exporting ATPase [Nitrosomonas sp. Nm51]|uniref:cation transporter n=1 Tax=Nitrosomonas sp. Nm51 TaxID=133720 RepID=UPI0008CF2CC1|nr:heavy metal-associated domain-containing protein [Nitrosomonas sp. Nm51]SER19490.1 Cu+-exporting ATPase [Nitrosomonas sp. Nm51]